ncbi:MAG TPA: PQQ-binding-like beta-propeller repeat protein [Candidatus Bathyarchaeia archaeon]|nr:PQQ-binding-like beta-propeller repeat protein [Candidatus Bathyarchaeia archaeon]
MNDIDSKISGLKEIIKKAGLVRNDKQKIISPEGREEAWLFDLRNIFLNSESLDLASDIFWHHFEKEYPFQVGGQEVAAVPLVSGIMMKSRELGKPVNGFIIRKSRKPTGLQKIVEGNLTDEKIILVDDLMNSGSTALRQLKVLESLGKKADSFFSLLNFRGESNVDLLKRKQVKLFSLFSLDDFGLSMREENSEKNNFEAAWHFQAPDPSYIWTIPKSAPMVDEKNIYFGSDNATFWALDQYDGVVLWKFKVGYGVNGKTIFSTPALDEEKVYFGSYDGNVYALDKSDGSLRWKFSDADFVGSSPALASDLGLLFIGLEFGLFRKQGGIAAIHTDTGKKIWDFQMPEFVHGSPAYCPEKRVVAIGGNDHCAYLFDAKKGKLKWRFKTDGDIKASFEFDVKRNLALFGSFDSNLYAVDIDSGELRGKFETKDYIYSTPKVHKGDVFFASTDKNLYSVNLDSGKLNWRFTAGGRIFSSPEIVDGKVLFGATDGKLYEVDCRSGKCESIFQTTERIMNKIVHNSKTKRFFLPTYANEIYCLKKRAHGDGNSVRLSA